MVDGYDTRTRKKKIEDELTLYHEKHFRGNPNYNATKIRYLHARLNRILGEENTEEIETHENEMLRLTIPSLWNVHIKGNAELKMEMGFEEFMFLVAEHTTEDLDKITVLRFYSLLDYIKGKEKRQ